MSSCLGRPFLRLSRCCRPGSENCALAASVVAVVAVDRGLVKLRISPKQAGRIKLCSTAACWLEVLTLPMPLVANAAGRTLMVASMAFLFRHDRSL